MHRRTLYSFEAQVNPSAWTKEAQRILTADVVRLLAELHVELEPQRKILLAERRERQARYDAGERPDYIDSHPAQTEDWKVSAIPADLMERRVEITGPASNGKMVVQMVNPSPSGVTADMAMIDFEDSMKPTWSNVMAGMTHIEALAREDLEFIQRDENGDVEKIYRLVAGKRAHPMIRVRGLHLSESNLTVGGEPISAAVFDLAVSAVLTARTFLAHHVTPKYYVPKCEHYLEARWWNRLFILVERALDLPRGTLRATFLIETLPAAFQMEEILYEVRERACGLNGGRWDKIFSDIKTLKCHKDRVLADRGSITMERSWMENYAKRLIKICHKHGAFAMGGMSAFTPGKDTAMRALQSQKVSIDKAREAHLGHDGCWVSHPFFVSIAREQFQKKNQLDVLLEDFTDRPNLLPLPLGPKTLEGLRTNVRVGIAYQKGWNDGLGCVSYENLMEDLATLEISRAQVWQWVHHGITLDTGEKVDRTLVARLFDEELERILNELKTELGSSVQNQKWDHIREQYVKAKEDARALFLKDELQEFLSTTSERARGERS